MLLKWARWLPYWIVVKLTKKTYSYDGRGTLKLNKDYKVTYYQLGEGEYLVFSDEVYNIYKQKRETKENIKRNKKLDKINKMMDSNCALKREIKEQFEFEKANEEEY